MACILICLKNRYVLEYPYSDTDHTKVPRISLIRVQIPTNTDTTDTASVRKQIQLQVHSSATRAQQLQVQIQQILARPRAAQQKYNLRQRAVQMPEADLCWACRFPRRMPLPGLPRVPALPPSRAASPHVAATAQR